MTTRILLLVSIFLIGCSTPSKFIPIAENSSLEWNDRFDSDAWREQYKKCQAFLYESQEAWDWCMDNEKLVYGQ